MLEKAKTGNSLLAWAAAVVCPLCIHLPMTNVVFFVCRLEKELAAAMVMASWPHSQSGLIEDAGGKTLPNIANGHKLGLSAVCKCQYQFCAECC